MRYTDIELRCVPEISTMLLTYSWALFIDEQIEAQK